MIRPSALALAALALLGSPGVTARADDAADARRDGIAAMYPVILAHRDAGRTDAARDLTAKVIEWQPTEPRHRFTLATIEAIADRADSALSALEKAVELGYTNAEQLAGEPSLASIRSSKRYTALVEKLAAGGDPKAKPATPEAKPAAIDFGPEVLPVEAQLTENGPVGAYFMSKQGLDQWSMPTTLEQALWYFQVGGQVNSSVKQGFSGKELAADGSTAGIVRRDGDQLQITWKDGKVRRARYEPKPDGSFRWDLGLFTRMKPLDRAAVLGTWEYKGASVGSNEAAGAENQLTQIDRITFAADGTFVRTTFRVLRVDNSKSKVTSTGKTEVRGRWVAGRHSLTLTDEGGAEARGIALTIDDSATPEPSDWLLLGGLVHKRVKP